MRFRFVLAAAFGVVAMAATAQAPPVWPTQTVRIVVPSPSGAGIDYVPRILAERLAPIWGQPVIVENRPGANTIIGTESVARAAPDGHTLLFSSDATFTVHPHVYTRLPFDAQRDFDPITQVITFYNLLVANPKLPVSNLQELIAYAKANPGRLTYATIGPGSVAHLLAAWLSHEANIDMLHVPYKGTPQTVTAVVSGEVDLTFVGVSSTQAFIQAGTLKPIAIAAPRRVAPLPNVPTFAELGYPSMDYTLWFGLFAPDGTPRAIVDKIQRDVARVLSDPEIRERDFKARAWTVSASTPAQFSAEIARELRQRAEMVKASGARLD